MCILVYDIFDLRNELISPCLSQAQADERARRLKEDLERKRREVFGEQKKQQQAKATPAPGMTEAMKAIGVVKETPP